MGKDKVKAADMNKSTVIGHFSGMCADAEITNENGLDITREVWENVFASDIYKQAIDLGWYIGYLGHPEDPNCMNFQDACIVMKEGHIEDDGKIYGEFDLIDTPVGRIVKSFIDAGVTFGISVRGAGDIIDNSVDPDTFVFRGFDLVSFPAYKEAIPEFTAIAASTDLEQRKKYQAVCAAVKNNLSQITSTEALDLVQSQFAGQSDEYQMIEDRKAELLDAIPEDDIDITSEQLEGVMQLYLDEKAKTRVLEDEVLTASTNFKNFKKDATRKLNAIQRITAAQSQDYSDVIAEKITACKTLKAASSRLKAENAKLSESNQKLIQANETLKNKNLQLISAGQKLKADYESVLRSNLKYKQKVEATANDINKKDSVISNLRAELSETVTAATLNEERTSNLDAKIEKLKKEVSAATALIEEYQNAYASLYASAIGVHLDDVQVTSTTSVKELESILGSSAARSQAITRPALIDVVDDYDDGDLVTM